MSAQTVLARTEQPASILREVTAAIVRLDILAVTAKQVREVALLLFFHPSLIV